MGLDDFERELQERNRAVSKPVKPTNEQLREYNEQPQVKDQGVKVVTISKDRTKNILLVLLGLVVLFFGVITYLAYSGNLDLVNVNLPACPTPAAIPACPNVPSCPACPSASACVNNLTCAPVIKICGNQTC